MRVAPKRRVSERAGTRGRTRQSKVMQVQARYHRGARGRRHTRVERESRVCMRNDAQPTRRAALGLTLPARAGTGTGSVHLAQAQFRWLRLRGARGAARSRAVSICLVHPALEMPDGGAVLGEHGHRAAPARQAVAVDAAEQALVRVRVRVRLRLRLRLRLGSWARVRVRAQLGLGLRLRLGSGLGFA